MTLHQWEAWRCCSTGSENLIVPFESDRIFVLSFFFFSKEFPLYKQFHWALSLMDVQTNQFCSGSLP